MRADRTGRVLLVEDNPADVRLTVEAFAERAPGIQVDVVSNGEEALDALQARRSGGEPLPDLVLLDLNMPRMDGRELLAKLRGLDELAGLPVLVLSSSEAEEDLTAVYDLGANCYISKPLGFEGFLEVVEHLVDLWFSKAQLPPTLAA